MPPVDLNKSVDQYFQFVQRTVDLNRDLVTSWAELVKSLDGATREQAESLGRIIKEQADTLADMAALEAEPGPPRTGNVDDLIDRLVETRGK